MNNRNLLIIFIAGLALYFGGQYWRSHRSSSFDPLIVAVDTTKVDRIQFVTAGSPQDMYELNHTPEGWRATKGTVVISPKPDVLSAIFKSLAQLNANRIVTSDKAKYLEYELEADKAGRVTAWQGNKKLADIFVGGFRFDQATRTASSFVRLADHDDVYEVEGFSGMGLKARFDQLRDKTLINVAAADLTALEWVGPSGQKKTLTKEGQAWYFAGMQAVDSVKFVNYLNQLIGTNGVYFSDLTSVQGYTLAEQLTLQGNQLPSPITITAYDSRDTLKPFLIHSSVNPDAVFTSDTVGIYKRIFGDLRQFWPDGK